MSTALWNAAAAHCIDLLASSKQLANLYNMVSLVKMVSSRLTDARLCGIHRMQAYLGVFTGGVVFIMSSFGGSVALRPPICGDLFGIKVQSPLSSLARSLAQTSQTAA